MHPLARSFLLLLAGTAAAFGTTAARADAATDLAALVRQCREAHAARPAVEVIYSEAVRAWVQRRHEPALIAWDLRAEGREPPQAVIDVTDHVSSGRADTEAAARALKEDQLQSLRIIRRLEYTYRNGRWEFAQGRTILGSLANPVGTALTREGIGKMGMPLAGCLPKDTER